MRYSVLLRRELSARNREFARQHGLPVALSYGEDPVVVYEPNAAGHGNFLPEYAAILKHPSWRARLAKPHTSARAALPAPPGRTLAGAGFQQQLRCPADERLLPSSDPW